MTLRSVITGILLSVVLTIGTHARAAADWLPGEVLLRLQPGTDLTSFNLQYGTQTLDQLPGLPILRLRIPLGADPATLSALLRVDPRVVWAEPNFFVRTPETRGSQWTSTFDGGTGTGQYQGQSSLRQVNYKEADTLSTGSGVTVAILDTGISLRHRSLWGKVVAGWNTLDESGQTDDAPNHRDDNGNGVVDEGTGHGTMVAGIVARLAPDAPLMPVKVLDSDGTGNLWDLVEGMFWAVENHARLLNLSLGIAQRSALLEFAVDEVYLRGAAIVTSAGNGNTSQPQYPAGVPRVLTVAALNANNTKAAFSNYGGMIDVSAPGVNIYSTNWNGRFAAGTGTSFAAPLATGELALIWSRWPELSNAQVQQIAVRTAQSVDRVNPAYRGALGAGIIDVDKAVGAS